MSYHIPSEDPRRPDGEDELYSDIHICRWEGKHCEEWASQVCRRRGVDIADVDLSRFRIENGVSLQKMSRQGYSRMVGDQYGTMFYKELRSYRAMQKYRCPSCVGSDTTHTLINPDCFGMQEMARDLSSPIQLTSYSRVSSPSPPPSYRQHVGLSSIYKEQYSPVTCENRQRYPDYLSPAMSYEESSPLSGYQERIMSPESNQSHLPPTPESYSSHSQSPQLGSQDQIYRKIHEDYDGIPRPRKPLPELLPLPVEEDVEDPAYIPPDSHQHIRRNERVFEHDHHNNHHVPEYFSSHPSVPSQHLHPHYIIPPTHHTVSRDVDRKDHPQVIRYVYPHHPGNYISSHPQHSINSYRHLPEPQELPIYESDDDGDESVEGNRRLVIDLSNEGYDDIETIYGLDERGHKTQSQVKGQNIPHLQKIPTKRRRDRGPKSWEFLMRLLACPKSNPSVIRWENQAEGSFRLVQPQEIANMWGKRSNKGDLSYNNFARALRYHYKTELLYKISERQLVYGCGPKALAFYNQLISEGNKSLMGMNTG